MLTDLGVAGGLVHHQVEGLQGAKGQEQVLDLQQGSRGRSAGMCMGKPLTSCSLGGPGAGLETCCCRPVLRGVRGQGIYMVQSRCDVTSRASQNAAAAFEVQQTDLRGQDSTALASGTQWAGKLGAVLLQLGPQCCLPPHQQGRSGNHGAAPLDDAGHAPKEKAVALVLLWQTLTTDQALPTPTCSTHHLQDSPTLKSSTVS